MNKVYDKFVSLITLRFTRRYFRLIFHLYLPNFRAILSKRVSFRSEPLCNQKVRFTGCGKVEIGSQCMFGFKPGGGYYSGCIEIQPRFENSIIRIGDNVNTNNNLFICSANYIEIGNDTFIGQGVTVMDFEAHGSKPDKRRELGKIAKVRIGKNVLIGNNVTILKNTKIGDNTMVVAHSVVAGFFPANVIIGGIPAQIIGRI